MNNLSTLKELKDKYVKEMKESGIESAAFDFDYILQEAADISLAELLTEPDKEPAPEQEKILTDVLDRYIKGEPLQYILGYTWFMGNKIKVSPDVLIPRYDTEVPCELANQYLEGCKKPKILDMCCGSGCIGLSLAKARPEGEVYLCDISPAAINLTRENAASLELNHCTKILQGDLFQALSEEKKLPKFNLIISNPPYISREIVKSLDSRVRDYEPSLALDGGVDGLDFYRKIISESHKYLVKGGMLIFETGYDQATLVGDMMDESQDFYNIEIFKDYGGNFRGVCGLYNGNRL